MEKFFNTAGPIVPEIHYFVNTQTRWNFQSVLHLIKQRKYFILHAPRQTGKTSGILALMHYLNETGQYESIYANIESAQAAREDVEAAMKAILSEIAKRHEMYTKQSHLKENWRTIFNESGGHQALNAILSYWAKKSALPVVLFFR